VLEADCGVHAGLAERAVDDTKFHKVLDVRNVKNQILQAAPPGPPALSGKQLRRVPLS
jgi:hypothetical protein